MGYERENDMDYEKFYGVKFVMDYNNGHLNNAKEVSDVPPEVNGNDDNIYVFCKKCGVYMNYQKLNMSAISGLYICPVCDKKVREETVYNKLSRQNNSWLKANYFDTEDYDELY